MFERSNHYPVAQILHILEAWRYEVVILSKVNNFFSKKAIRQKTNDKNRILNINEILVNFTLTINK